MRCGGIERSSFGILNINLTPDASRFVGLINSVKTSYSKLYIWENVVHFVVLYLLMFFHEMWSGHILMRSVRKTMH